MNLFFEVFNAKNLAAIGVRLPPRETNELIESLADTLRERVNALPADADIQVEFMRLFQEVEEHVDEIMGNGWRLAA